MQGGGGGPTVESWDVGSRQPPEITDPPFAGYLQRRQENVRGLLACGFAALFALTIAWSCFAWHIGVNPIPLLHLFLPAETALLGSVLGFYFGTKASGS